MGKLKSSKLGFTLIEVLIVMTLIGVVIAAASGLFIYSLRMDQKTRTILEVKQAGDNAMSTMVSKIRTAQEINLPVCGVSPSPSEIIDFTDIDDDNIVFNLDSGKIKLNGDNLTSADVVVDLLEFSCFEGDQEVIEINFRLIKGPGSDPQRDVSLDFMTSVSLRNY